MTTFYHPVGAPLFHFIEYRTETGGVTGKVQGDFTIQVSSRTAGNLPVAAITITEVDAVNNPGVYRINCAATSFVSTIGDYELSIFDTANPEFSWGGTVKVAYSNTFPTFVAEFSSTTGNGRVTDGGSPLVGATVDLRDGSGDLITRVITGADGNWGPVYLASTVTAFAQKSGFAQGSAQITVSGSVATGPGTDIVLTASSVTASLAASSLWSYAKRVARDRSGARSDEVIRSAVNDAIAMLSRDLDSQWWHRQKDITLRGAYEVGTIDATQGSPTITLTGGVFPSWSSDAGARLRIGGRMYEVGSRDSDTQLTLAVPYSGETVTDGSYSLLSISTALPDNLLRIQEIFYGQDWVWGTTPVSFSELVGYQRAYQWTQDRSYAWAIAQARIHVWPAPENDSQVSLTYYAKPMALVSSSDTADVDPIHLDILYRAIDHQIALRFGDTEGELNASRTLDLYRVMVQGAATYDRNMPNKPSPVGTRNRRQGLLRGLQVPPQ